MPAWASDAVVGIEGESFDGVLRQCAGRVMVLALCMWCYPGIAWEYAETKRGQMAPSNSANKSMVCAYSKGRVVGCW
uniref:Uncharacterized protein n=1 Tax=Oryza rufipogon TaxID=4529 RepID=A0A0E0PBV0_ORYRU